MNQFLTQLCLTPVDEKTWRLTAPLIFRSARLAKDITVPAGFETDLASVPNALPLIHTLFADVGKEAAVVHDFLLVEGKLLRSTCDHVYQDALKCCSDAKKWKYKPMFWGVHAWTWIKGVFA